MTTSDVTCAKPRTIFDREAEWSELVAFANDPRAGPTLGIVTGRRRQGKTYLLQALTKVVDGFYFAAQEAAEADSLRRLSDEFAQYTRAPHPVGWQRWEEAVDALLALGDESPLPVVVDQFPTLVQQSPALPSVIHAAYRRLRDGRRRNRTRLLLSGSAMSVMHRLFSGPSPLHGLAGLDLVVRSLDFRQAATFWGIGDPRLALLVHAVVGGTPAYRGDYICDDTPDDPHDFDAWVCRTLLNPRMPIFREASHLLEEEADHLDRAMCHSVLAAIASGCSTRGEVAQCLHHQLTDVTRALTLLHDHDLLVMERDAFRPSLVRYRITEPLLAFDHAVVRPNRSALEQEEAASVWRRARAVFDSAVLAPHFAQVCREWAANFAAPATFGATPNVAEHGSLPEPAKRACHEAEVVVCGRIGSRPDVLLSVGLARWNDVMEISHLERIRYILDVLADRGEDINRAKPACYSGAGFAPELRAAQARGEVMLVGLDQLYAGA